MGGSGRQDALYAAEDAGVKRSSSSEDFEAWMACRKAKKKLKNAERGPAKGRKSVGEIGGDIGRVLESSMGVWGVWGVRLGISVYGPGCCVGIGCRGCCIRCWY